MGRCEKRRRMEGGKHVQQVVERTPHPSRVIASDIMQSTRGTASDSMSGSSKGSEGG